MKHWKKILCMSAAAAALALLNIWNPVSANGLLKDEAPAETEEEEPLDDGTGISAAYGKAEGALGDTMRASFLKFTLNSAATASSYQSITADEGMQLLVLNITTKVTQKHDLLLYDTDYQIQWGGEGAGDYSEPVTYRDEWADFVTYKKAVSLEGITSLFPGQQALVPGETITYDYVYQVPAGLSDFQLLFREYYEDEDVGDLFVVTFHAESAGAIEGTLGEIVPASGAGHVEVVNPKEAAAEQETETNTETGETTG